MGSMHEKLGIAWVVVVLLLFLLTGLLGFLMRLSQSGILSIDPKLFYTILTLHGQANAVMFFLVALMVARALLSHHLALSRTVSLVLSIAMLLGLVGVAIVILLGGLSYGWYFLYPIIFYEGDQLYNVAWILLVALIGICILILSLEVVIAASRKYGFGRSLGWHYLSGDRGPDVPPIVMISTASSIVSIAATVAGASLLLGLLAQNMGLISRIDPLGAKNLTFMFGHTIVNLAMFFTIAAVYEAMPAYSGRPWKSNWVVALAWNIAIIYILMAMFHHLYMDFVQPLPLQVTGHVFSYVSAVPAIVVTIIGALAHIFSHRARQRSFGMVPLFILLGIGAWVAGGAAAVIDATIPVNFLFHNTLWVPAHFHTYYGYGVVVMLMALAWSILEKSGSQLPRSSWLAPITLMTLGWSLHLASFYIGGALSVPRRYATYEALPEPLSMYGKTLAILSMGGIIIYALGYISFLYHTMKRAYRFLGGAP